MTFLGCQHITGVAHRPARYGGNIVREPFLSRRTPFIFDAGTGIKALSDALMAAKRTRIDGKILLTHPHWDHINALPFVPLRRGNQFEICGPAHGDVSVRDQVSGQMDGVYFPVTGARVRRQHHLSRPERGRERSAGVPTMLLSHPGNCLGYRLEHGGRSLLHPDNELSRPTRVLQREYVERLADFVRGTDVLITDCAT
jgi:phosphoribosyl 1,2-cyclic phosphodiesterase